MHDWMEQELSGRGLANMRGSDSIPRTIKIKQNKKTQQFSAMFSRSPGKQKTEEPSLRRQRQHVWKQVGGWGLVRGFCSDMEGMKQE